MLVLGRRGRREYFLKLQILASPLKKKNCYFELLIVVHLFSSASQKTDREKPLFLRKKWKPLLTIPEEIVSDNEPWSVNLKFLAFEMVLPLPSPPPSRFTSSSDHPQGKGKMEGWAQITQKIPVIKGPLISCTDYKVSPMTVSRVWPAL